MTHQGYPYPYYSDYSYPQPHQNTQAFSQGHVFDAEQYYAQGQYDYSTEHEHPAYPAEGSWQGSMPQGYPASTVQGYPNQYAIHSGPPIQEHMYTHTQMPMQAPPATTQVQDASVELKICAHCGTQSTPEWRREPHSHRLLCNACGLHLSKKGYHRPLDIFPQPPEPPPNPNGRRCSNCGTHSAPTWRRSADGNTLCNACGMYERTHGKDRPIGFHSSSHFKPRKHKDRTG